MTLLRFASCVPTFFLTILLGAQIPTSHIEENRLGLSVEVYAAPTLRNGAAMLSDVRSEWHGGAAVELAWNARWAIRGGVEYYTVQDIQHVVYCFNYPCPDSWKGRMASASLGISRSLSAGPRFAIASFAEVAVERVLSSTSYYSHSTWESWEDQRSRTNGIHLVAGLDLAYSIHRSLSLFVSPTLKVGNNYGLGGAPSIRYPTYGHLVALRCGARWSLI